MIATSLEHPSWGCVKLADYLRNQGVWISSPTVQKLLIRNEMGSVYERWMLLEKKHLEEGLELSPEQIAKIEHYNPVFKERHVESSRPGELLSQDTFYVGYLKGIGKVYLHAVVDTFSSYAFGCTDEYSRFRFFEAYQQANTWSSADFVRKLVRYFKRRAIKIETIQTDNGSEFTAYYSRNDRSQLSLFKQTLELFGIQHKRIKPYTPRHNGKVERSHREDQKRFYSKALFYSFKDFRTQLKRHNYRSNRISMKPLGFLSPLSFLAQTVQYV